MREITPYEIAREYIHLNATEISPLRYRLRKYTPEALADIVKRAAELVCASGLPHFIDRPDLWRVFWHPLTDAQSEELVHYALDSARKDHNKQTGWSSGPSPQELDSRLEERLSRFTDRGGQSYDPVVGLWYYEIEKAAELARVAQAAENAAYQRAANEYESQQTKPKHLEAVRLLRCGLSYEDIRQRTCNAEGRLGISERILKPHKDALTRIAEACLLTDYDGLPYTDDSPLPEDAPDDVLSVQETPDTEEIAETAIEKVERCPDGSKALSITGNFTPSEGSAVAPADDITVSGGFRSAPAYIGGEDAQFDARDKIDYYDSANYRGAKQTGPGRCSAGRRQNSDHALISGYLFPTREEMAVGPGYRYPAVYIPAGSRVRHAVFGEGTACGTGSSDAPYVLVSFSGTPRMILHSYLEIILPEKESSTERELALEQALIRQGKEASVIELKSACEAAGISLASLFGEGAG